MEHVDDCFNILGLFCFLVFAYGGCDGVVIPHPGGVRHLIPMFRQDPTITLPETSIAGIAPES